MHCEGCEESVVESLRALDGVEDAHADHESGTVSIDGDADHGDVRRAVEDAGYTLEEQ